MKNLCKMIATLIAVVMVVCMIPSLSAPASAATTPVLVLSATTAVNPILNHHLDYETYKSGGPFTVSFEWKGNLKPNDATDVKGCHGLVNVTGTISDAKTEQKNAGFAGYNPPQLPSGNTDWSKHSFQFQDVGTYPMTGTTKAGNILRFGLWKAKGSMYIKNVLITNAAGEVLYDLNTDEVVKQAVANTQAMGMTECDMSELAAIDYEHCPWVANQFSTGNYTSTLTFEGGEMPPSTTTTSSVTRPTTSASTSTASTATKPTVSESTTAPTTDPTSEPSTEPTTEPTTIPTTVSTTVSTIEPTNTPVTASTTKSTSVTTRVTTVPHAEVDTDDAGEGEKGGIDPVIWVIIAAVVVLGLGVAVFCFIKAKKKD